MKLKIKNCAKISYAEFEFNGLTVIAGNNNTGKSTVGKVLYSLFRSLSNADKRVIERRQESIRQYARRIIFGYKFLEEKGLDIVTQLMQGETLDQIVTACWDEICKVGGRSGFLKVTNKERVQLINETIARLNEKIEIAQGLTNEQYQAIIVQNVFDCVFHKQVRPLRNPKLVPELTLEIKGEKNVIRFTDAGCEVRNPTKVRKTVRYIATPDVLSLINNKALREIDAEVEAAVSSLFEKYVWELARELHRDGEGLSTAEQIEISESLKDLNQILNQIVKGDFKRDNSSQDAPFSLFEEGQEATKAENLSMGLKFFVLLRHMLQKGILSKKDILILDEPENHLHPEWQVQYAKILVLLQKTYDLTLLVTSHSTFFVNALQQAALAKDVSERTKFYLAVEDKTSNGGFTFEENNIFAADIFRSFNKGFERIDEIASENEL